MCMPKQFLPSDSVFAVFQLWDRFANEKKSKRREKRTSETELARRAKQNKQDRARRARKSAEVAALQASKELLEPVRNELPRPALVVEKTTREIAQQTNLKAEQNGELSSLKNHFNSP